MLSQLNSCDFTQKLLHRNPLHCGLVPQVTPQTKVIARTYTIHKQKPEQLIIHFAGFLAAALRFGFSGSAAAFAWAFAWALALASADRLVDLVGALVGTVFGKIGLEKAMLVRWKQG